MIFFRQIQFTFPLRVNGIFMRILALAFFSIYAVCSTQAAHADLRAMGTDYRTMLSNFHMIADIEKRCPEVEVPPVEPRSTVEKMLQDKLGMELYVQTMIKLQKSNLRKDALATVETLWEKIEGCEDKRLDSVLNRIAGIHAESFARFEKEPTLVKPKPVPIPMRQR